MKKVTLIKNILNLLNNNHTLIEEVDSQTNYYNFITDTIYLSKNLDSLKQTKGLENTNPFCAELITICHECIHSVQSKILHVLNLILSNLSLILTIVTIIIMLFFSKPLWWIVFCLVTVICAAIVRLLLEIDAITKSVKLAGNVIENRIINGVDKNDVLEAKKIIKKMLPMQIIKMILDKIIMIIVGAI